MLITSVRAKWLLCYYGRKVNALDCKSWCESSSLSSSSIFISLFFYMNPNDVPESDPSTLPVPELSFGQKAVGLTFNPG